MPVIVVQEQDSEERSRTGMVGVAAAVDCFHTYAVPVVDTRMAASLWGDGSGKEPPSPSLSLPREAIWGMRRAHHFVVDAVKQLVTKG